MRHDGTQMVKEQFFMGYLYSVCVSSIAMSNVEIENSYNTESLNVPASFSTCGYDQYETAGVCYDCNQSCSEADGTCSYDASQCTW